MIIPRNRTIACLLAVLAPSVCFGWGRDGHRIVAQIAWQHLDAKAQAAVNGLLGDQDLPGVSTWADEIRGEPRYHWSAPLHYVNLPAGAKSFDPKRDCPEGNCVVSAITKYAAILRDGGGTTEQQQEALKFLVHFVGDVHQPLHVSYARDRGGNDVVVEYFDNRTNLHKVWDDLLILRAGKPWRQYADDLREQISKEQIAAWTRSMDPGDWATESFQVTANLAYNIPKDGRLGQEYFESCLPVVNERLSMAGVRLAYLLNSILGNSPAPAIASAPAEHTEPTTAPAATMADPEPSTVSRPASASQPSTAR